MNQQRDSITNSARMRAEVFAFAAGDFSMIAREFVHAGFQVMQPERGVLQIISPDTHVARMRVLISVGVHGDETAPIEMLARVLTMAAQTPAQMKVDLMIVIGNLDAVAQQRRYVDTDLNRQFHSDSHHDTTRENQRAHALMRLTADFFLPPAAQKIHLDLHTAIRLSLYPSFAIMPQAVANVAASPMINWLTSAAIDAIVVNLKPAGTFSAYTSQHCGATSATLEFGQVSRLGENDPAQYSTAQSALELLLQQGALPQQGRALPPVFDVVREIIKHSAGFTMTLDRSTRNFTPLQQGQQIASEERCVYRAEENQERILFPNPDVEIGRRAALIVVQR